MFIQTLLSVLTVKFLQILKWKYSEYKVRRNLVKILNDKNNPRLRHCYIVKSLIYSIFLYV